MPPTLRESLARTGLRVARRVLRDRHANGKPVSGSFPPYSELFCVGSAKNFFIHDGYQHRVDVPHYDDTSNADEWQLEVYRFAREVCDREQLRNVCDVGCGSAYKLMKFFPDLNTVGMEVAATCAWLRKRYPRREWMESDFSKKPRFQPDLVIAADIIEHLLNPTVLLDYLSFLEPRYIVLSTPDRNLKGGGTHNGPPRNPHHVREWNVTELHAYVASVFEIHEHFISCAAQATQCILCSPAPR